MSNIVFSDYVILEDDQVSSLMSKVKSLILKGWIPMGGVAISPPGGSRFITEHHYLQAMIMPKIASVSQTESKATDPENDKIKEINNKIANGIDLTKEESSLRMISCRHFYNEIDGHHCCWAEGEKSFPECYPFGIRVGAPWPTTQEECSKCMTWQFKAENNGE